jgi:hypothetical protein
MKALGNRNNGHPGYFAFRKQENCVGCRRRKDKVEFSLRACSLNCK